MGGKSDQEKASEKQYADISKFNPTVQNRFEGNVLPHAPNSFLPAFNQATQAGVKDLGRQTGKNIKTAQKSTTAGMQSRGYGGSILQDAIAKARAGESETGTNAIKNLLTQRLGMLPGVMGAANQQQMGLLGAQQGVDFGNIQNMFNKFGAKGGAIQGLSDDTWLDSLLAVGNTAAGFVPLFA